MEHREIKMSDTIYKVRDPTGEIREIRGPEGASDEEVIAQAQKLFAQTQGLGLKDVAAAVPETALALGSGLVAGPLSGLAGIAGSLLPGPQGQGARWTRGVGEALTYQPRTEGGKIGLGIASKPFELLHQAGVKAGETAQDVGLPPSIATGVQTAVETAPALLLGARAKPSAAAKALSPAQ